MSRTPRNEWRWFCCDYDQDFRMCQCVFTLLGNDMSFLFETNTTFRNCKSVTAREINTLVLNMWRWTCQAKNQVGWLFSIDSSEISRAEAISMVDSLVTCPHWLTGWLNDCLHSGRTVACVVVQTLMYEDRWVASQGSTFTTRCIASTFWTFSLLFLSFLHSFLALVLFPFLLFFYLAHMHIDIHISCHELRSTDKKRHRISSSGILLLLILLITHLHGSK